MLAENIDSGLIAFLCFVSVQSAQVFSYFSRATSSRVYDVVALASTQGDQPVRSNLSIEDINSAARTRRCVLVGMLSRVYFFA